MKCSSSTEAGYSLSEKNQVGLSAFTEANLAENRLIDVASRLNALTNKLLGPLPEINSAGAVLPQPSGLFNGLGESARNCNNLITTMNNAIDRIEKALPQV
jgi:hypothetical protein